MKIKASIPFFRASLHLEITSLKYFNVTISHANYVCIKYLWYTRYCALWRKKRDMKCIIIFRKADSQSEHCGLSVYKLCQVFLFKKISTIISPTLLHWTNQYKSIVKDSRCLQFLKTYSGDCDPLLVWEPPVCLDRTVVRCWLHRLNEKECLESPKARRHLLA